MNQPAPLRAILNQYIESGLINPTLDTTHFTVDEAIAGAQDLISEANRLILALEALKHDRGTLCSDCMSPQFMTVHGVTCKNGHGGAAPYDGPFANEDEVLGFTFCECGRLSEDCTYIPTDPTSQHHDI